MCILTQHTERVDEDLPTAQNIEGGNMNSKYARNTIKLLNREGNSEGRDTDNNSSQGSCFQSIPRDTDHVRDVVSDILFVQESAAAQRSNILLSLHDDASNPDSVPFRWDFVPLFEL